MKKFKVIKDAPFDEGLPKIINLARQRTQKENDEFFLLGVGLTGTGKSTLSLWGYSLYDPNAQIDYMCLDRAEFTLGLKMVRDKAQPRFLCYDEAAITSREAMTQWNREVVKLYMRIRGLNIFHWWNNPSPQIDRLLIQEKINGIIYIYTKKSPRKYIYFTRQRILDILDVSKKDRLTLGLLHKYKHFGNYRGWFREYKGALWEPYIKKKFAATDTAIDDFDAKFGKKAFVSSTEVARAIGVSHSTVNDKAEKLMANPEFVEGVHYILNGFRKPKWNKQYLNLVKKEITGFS